MTSAVRLDLLEVKDQPLQRSVTLSIVIITMNRKDQLLEAIDSCLGCQLPSETEFIIIDNASADGTGDAVKIFFEERKGHSYTYKRLSENKGVGGGRNEGFKLAQGEYAYFLDDDAVIGNAYKDTFFTKSIEILNKNQKVATLTTRVWDEILQSDRTVVACRNKKINGYDTICTFLGGSHFIRRSAFDLFLYSEFKYGAEEIMPSFYSLDKGLHNLYVPEIAIIHKPKFNKWEDGTTYKQEILCRNNAGVYAAKYLLYPAIFRPVLFLAFVVRWYLHLRKFKNAFQESFAIFKEQTKNVRIKKIRCKTIIAIFREFGPGAGI